MTVGHYESTDRRGGIAQFWPAPGRSAFELQSPVVGRESKIIRDVRRTLFESVVSEPSSGRAA